MSGSITGHEFGLLLPAALKEYVSDPPSDELIASVEEELGYKLPAAYIWLMKQQTAAFR